jgi:hypothetical protein
MWRMSMLTLTKDHLNAREVPKPWKWLATLRLKSYPHRHESEALGWATILELSLWSWGQIPLEKAPEYRLLFAIPVLEV